MTPETTVVAESHGTHPSHPSQLPNGWKFVSLGKLVSVKNGADYKVDEVAEGGFPVFGSGGVFGRSSRYIFDGESVLFGRKGTIDRPVHVTGKFWTVDTMFYTVLGNRISGRFLYYFATTVDYGYYATNTAVPSMTQRDIATFKVPLPSLEIQRQIADYLDTHTAKIDTLIGKQEQLIETLAERRQAVISHAVTKGLDPNAALKDSGVEWLGTVPSHWTVTAMKRILAIPITDGPHETPDFLDDGVPFVSAEAVSSGVIRFDKIRGHISPQEHARFSRKYLPARNDIYVVKSGATTGVAAIVETDEVFNIWSPLAAIRVRSGVVPRFLLNFIRSREFQSAIELHWSYGTQQNIGMGTLGQLAVALPPGAEQLEIAKFLSFEMAQIDALSAKAREMIDVLKERRQALISAAVTGKIDVRGPA